jgi:hypothetical protein
LAGLADQLPHVLGHSKAPAAILVQVRLPDWREVILQDTRAHSS